MEHTGQPLSPWTEGTLDLHHISTGLGVAALFVFPDGTTMLLDAGELDPTDPRTHSPRNAPARPDPSRPPHEWIARYIRQALPHEPEPALDYAVLSHFHDDHIGIVTELAPPSRRGPYRLTGIVGVGDEMPIRTLIDRGYPDYGYPMPLDDPAVVAWIEQRPDLQKPYRRLVRTMDNYRQFIAWQQAHAGMRAERLQPGRNDQIGLRRRPAAWDFEVRNVCANGEVWTGVGTNTRRHVPPIADLGLDRRPDENTLSIGLCLRYGRFRYFNGSDIPGIVELDLPAWADLETPVAQAVGPVDVHVLNHHGYRNTHNEFFVRTLRPRVMVQQVWSADQPGHGVLKRLTSTYLYPGPRDLFATDMLEANRLVIGELIDQAYQSQHGHVLVRVERGGERYGVIVLDDTLEMLRVKSVHGPYTAR